MQAAGHGEGFETTLTTERVQEIPDYAVLIQNACAEIGIKLNLRIEDPAAYYGTAQFGRSDWLDSPMGITDYGHRGVPDVTLAAPFLSNGAWNAAHFKNPEYDRLVAAYVAAIDLPTQRGIASRIQNHPARRNPCDHPVFLRLPLRDRPHRHRRRSQRIITNLPAERSSRLMGGTLRAIGRRLALSLLTLVLLSAVVFAAGQLLPGDVGRSILGPLADSRAVAALNHQLGTDQPPLLMYIKWVGGPAAWRYGAILCLSQPGGAIHPPRARQIPRFGRHHRRDRDTHLDRRRHSRRAQCRQMAGPADHFGRAFAHHRPRIRLRHPADSHFRRLAALAADLGQYTPRHRRAGADTPSDPARSPAGADPVRLYLANCGGQG